MSHTMLDHTKKRLLLKACRDAGIGPDTAEGVWNNLVYLGVAKNAPFEKTGYYVLKSMANPDLHDVWYYDSQTKVWCDGAGKRRAEPLSYAWKPYSYIGESLGELL